jgi:hypothetical protein
LGHIRELGFSLGFSSFNSSINANRCGHQKGWFRLD